jgi:hypothetical protein
VLSLGYSDVKFFSEVVGKGNHIATLVLLILADRMTACSLANFWHTSQKFKNIHKEIYLFSF